MTSQPAEVIAPLFDRLIDDEPHVPSERTPFRSLTADELKKSIQNEINMLLNSRGNKVPFCVRSILNDLAKYVPLRQYGLSDFSTYDVANTQGKKDLVSQIVQAIVTYEPRLVLLDIKVGEYNHKTQSLRVDLIGMLNVEPLAEHFSFPVYIGKNQ